MSARRPPCTCLAFDDLCPSCERYGKAKANHQRELGRTAPAGDHTPQPRRNRVPDTPQTPAARFAATHHVTEAEAAHFLAQQDTTREERRWWRQWEVQG